MPKQKLATALLIVLLRSLASASDLPVTYNVQDKGLKSGAPAGTQLTFTLFTDSACANQVYQALIAIEDVTLISKLKLATPKHAAKAPVTDQIQATLTGVTVTGNLYLTVTGPGVSPAGATCQVQSAAVVVKGTLVVTDANGQTVAINGVHNSGGRLVNLVPQRSRLLTNLPGCRISFASNDCSGPPLLPPDDSLTVDACLNSPIMYVPPTTPGTLTPLGSQLFINRNTITGPGACVPGAFVAPNACCQGLIQGATDTVAPAHVEDLSVFVPPFQIDLR